MSRIATRNGRPAWKDAPEPVKAPVPMRDWLKRHAPHLENPNDR